MVVARELTKKFEEILRGEPERIKQLLGERKVRGELVVLVEGRST